MADATTLQFEFNGTHEITVPATTLCIGCARDVIEGRSYPLPVIDQSHVRCVVDLGAHTGEFTVMAALLWSQAQVHAYEPNPEILPFLRHNCQPFSNITIHPQAVNASGGLRKLYLSRLGSVAGSLVPGMCPNGEPATASLQVTSVPASEISALKPDVLKVDIEGLEIEVLAAVRESLPEIERIYVEFHSEQGRKLLDRLLDRTHALTQGRIATAEQGELMYLRRV